MIGIDFDNTLVHVNDDNSYVIMNGVKEYLPKIFNMGYKLIVITGRKESDSEFVKKVITELETLINVKFDKIVLTNDLPTKGEIAKIHNCIYLIDDKHSYLTDCIKHNVVPIYLNEKNKYVSSKKETVMYNWRQVYDFLKRKKSN